MAYNVYFEDVEVGQELPGFKRRTDLMNWNRYAAVNDEFIPIHMDDEAGRQGQNEQGAFGMGNLSDRLHPQHAAQLGRRRG